MSIFYTHKDGVSFRKLERHDLGDLLKLKCESWWGTHNVHIANLEDQNAWFDDLSKDMFLVGEKEKPIGVAVFSEIDWTGRTLSISGSLYKESRAEAYPAFCAGLDFAFEMLNMERCNAEVLEYHVTAQKLEIDKLGFRVEGRRRQAVYKCGRYYDSFVLGILREEWANCGRVLAYGDTCNLNFSHSKFERLRRRLQANYE